MAGAAMNGSDVADSSDGGGLYMFMFISFLDFSNQPLDVGAWRDLAQVNSDLTKVATPCCLLWMDPARWKPGILRMLLYNRCPIGIGQVMYDFEFGSGKALDIELEHWQTTVFDGRDDCTS